MFSSNSTQEVETFTAADDAMTLAPTLAVQNPIFMFHDEVSNAIHYSTSLASLLSSNRLPEKHLINFDSISELLRFGVVVPPATVFRNLYTLNLGNQAHLTSAGSLVRIDFGYQYPFLQEGQDFRPDPPNEAICLEKLANAVICGLNGEPGFLFHSAGKDSNFIALALADHGLQDQITLVSHRSAGDSDESEISRKIAGKLGFQHVTLDPESLDVGRFATVCKFISRLNFPVVDRVALAFPYYDLQIPELRNSNVIIGDASDFYMGVPLNPKEKFYCHLSPVLSRFRRVANHFLPSESSIFSLTRTPPEWFGLTGFSSRETQEIFPQGSDRQTVLARLNTIYDWNNPTKSKTELYSSIIISPSYIHKFREATAYWKSELILPFASPNVVEYYSKISPEYLFDDSTCKNKLFIRDILKNRLGLDSDDLGKLGYTFNFETILSDCESQIRNEVLSCRFWNRKNVEPILERLYRQLEIKREKTLRATNLILRLFILSAWLNRNPFVDVK